MFSPIVGIILLLAGLSDAATNETACGLLNRCLSRDCVVLGATTVTNTGVSNVTGDVCLSPGTSITGFPPGVITSGTTHAADTFAANAQLALTCVYTALHNFTTCDTNLTGQDLGNKTLTPGVYCFASSAQLTGTVTLNANGDTTTPFVFQIGSTLTTASASHVVLANGTTPCQVFWVIGSSATLGTSTVFNGIILAQIAITVTTTTTVNGRLLARTAAVTLDTDNVNICACPLVPTTASATTETSGNTEDNDDLDTVGIVWISVLGALCLLVTIILLAYGCFINGYAFVPFDRNNEYSTAADMRSSWTASGRRKRMYDN